MVVKDGQIIATGTNQVTSILDPTAHAEIVAIREACRRLGSFRLEGCEIYCSCEPCPMCLGAIYWAGLDKLCYAATREEAAFTVQEEKLRRSSQRSLPRFCVKLPSIRNLTSSSTTRRRKE